MFNFENKAKSYIKENYFFLMVFLVTLIAFLIILYMLKFKSGDYIHYLSPWFDAIKNSGGLRGIATYEGNYNAPYVTILAVLSYIPINKIYLIKGVSIIFDFILSISSSLLIRHIFPKNKFIVLFTYCVILILPEVCMNSALWAQCDSIYASFVILSILYLLKEKYIKSFIFLGVAFAFKLQFIFILPVYIVLYICKNKISVLHFLIIPLTNIVLCIPAIMMGMPISKTFSVYFSQTTYYKNNLTMNFPNIYNILPGKPDIFYKVGVLLTITICILMLGYVIYKKVKWNDEKIITLSLWFIVAVTFLLPGMHERYLYVGEILAVISLIAYKKNVHLTLFVVTSSIITYSSFLFGFTKSYLPILSILYLVIITFFTKNTLKELDL